MGSAFVSSATCRGGEAKGPHSSCDIYLENKLKIVGISVAREMGCKKIFKIEKWSEMVAYLTFDAKISQ